MIKSSLNAATIHAPVLLVAVRADDATIGCGGLIAELLQLPDRNIEVVIMSSDSPSRPRPAAEASWRYLKERERAALDALEVLGLASPQVTFWRSAFSLSVSEGPEFTTSAERAIAHLHKMGPATLVLPSQIDARPDHRAANAVWASAIRGFRVPPVVLEYMIWSNSDAASPGIVFGLDIGNVLPIKRKAIAEHRSRLHGIESADLVAGNLPESVLEAAQKPVEIYFGPAP